MSSCLNALAAVTWEDFLKPILGHRLTEQQKTWVTKILVLIFGGAGIGMAFMAQGLGGTVLQASLSFTGAASGPILGLFLLGGLFPWANGYGAVAGGLLGLAIPLWISIGAYNLPPAPLPLPFPTSSCAVTNTTSNTTTTTITTTINTLMTTWTSSAPATSAPVVEELSGVDLLYTVSYLWYPSIGVAIVIIVGLVVSFITGPMSIEEVDPKYLIPLFDRLFCCLPASWRRTLRCNKEFPRPKDIRPDGDETEMEIPADDGEKPPENATTNIYTLSNGKQSVSSLDSGRGSDVFGDDMTGRDVTSNGVDKMTTRL